MKNIFLDKGSIYEKNLRVVVYARVSTLEESQSTSIVNQVTYFDKFVQGIDNWVLVGTYIDFGISGKNAFKRENFMKMVRDGMNGEFDLILTKSVSRFARNTIDSIKYTDMLKSHGVYVYFIHDNINTFNSDSEFRLTLMASIAQDEIRKLSESVKFGLKQSINRGIVLGNSNILGYVKDGGKLVVDEEEALVVRDIFELFVSNQYTYSEVAKIVNVKYGRLFDGGRIKRVLTNHKYKGYYCGRKSEVVDYKCSKRRKVDRESWVLYRDEANVPMIVEEKLWEEVNKIVENRNSKRYQGMDCYYRKLWCVDCENYLRRKIKRYKSRVYCYYVCRCRRFQGQIFDKICRNLEFDKIFILGGEEAIKIRVRIKPRKIVG